MEVYEGNGMNGCLLHHDDVSKSLLLGLKSILHKDLSPSQFIWLHLAKYICNKTFIGQG